ncbi:MAG: NAD(P)/FAD-dependent oxidoreductase [Vampirovibrionales bacterium]|nr:NAD(P)/FAD-dependent oxidoreductase [Vampirovibrionales bacterium]
MNTQPDVLIIGAGMAGLTCAARLQEAGISCQLLEASDEVGGRVQSDTLDGFILDRGFQVFLSAYPEAKRWLNYKALDLKAFQPGAWSYFGGRFHTVSDPFQMPWTLLPSLLSPVGTLSDKLQVLKHRLRWMRLRAEGVAPAFSPATEDDWMPTHHWLDNSFSAEMIQHFWQPFLGGISLDGSLSAPQWLTRFTMAMMVQGQVMLPANGMKSIPEQLAARLPEGSICLNTVVSKLDIADRSVTLITDEIIRARRGIIIATSLQERHRLVNKEAPLPEFYGTTCLYYAAKRPPLDEPVLVLNGAGYGVINSLCVPSLVSPAYAPAGQSLVSVTVMGTPSDRSVINLDEQVRSQLSDWFGRQVNQWQTLRVYRIANALPRISTAWSDQTIAPGIYACGDYQAAPSLQGAMVSGRRCAEKLINQS